MIKKFDKALYAEFDQKGKDTVSEYFERQGYLVARNPNKYAGDLLLLKRTSDGLYEKVAIVEVGCRPSWTSHEFTFPDLRIEERKAKYLNEGLPVWFCVINHDFSGFIMLDKTLTNFPKKEVNNKYMKNELNFIIPKAELKFIELVKPKADRFRQRKFDPTESEF